MKRVAHLLLASVCGLAAFAVPAQETSPVDLKFRDFYVAPIGPRGLEMSPVLKAADGRRVRIVGYMVAQEDATADRFFLTPLPVRMSEHADGEADDLPPSTVVVEMPQAKREDGASPLPHTAGLLQLTGVLRVGRHELPDGRITWVRLQLDPKSSSTGL